MFQVRLLSALKAAPAGFFLVLALASCATAAIPVAQMQRAAEPEWTRAGGLHPRFSSQMYLTAVGYGNSRQAAEMDAFRALVSIFGVDVQADVRLAEGFRGTEGGGGHQVDFGSEIVLGAGMENLIGAEIGDRWDDGRRDHFALAVLNRARATQVYSEMIRANQDLIASLTNLPPGDRNSFDGFSRYQSAAAIADMNATYAAVLSAVGSPQYAQGLRTGDDLRRDAQQIAAAIPIGINVRGDRAGRIQGAFASAFAGQGFRTNPGSQRYMLNVDIVLLPADFQGPNVFARMELSANLVDARTGTVLLPFNFNLREGHRSQSEAEHRTFLVAEQRIERDYGAMLANYLAGLVPSR